MTCTNCHRPATAATLAAHGGAYGFCRDHEWLEHQPEWVNSDHDNCDHDQGLCNHHDNCDHDEGLCNNV